MFSEKAKAEYKVRSRTAKVAEWLKAKSPDEVVVMTFAGYDPVAISDEMATEKIVRSGVEPVFNGFFVEMTGTGVHVTFAFGPKCRYAS